MGFSLSNASYNLFQNNSIKNSGAHGILFDWDPVSVSNSFIDNFFNNTNNTGWNHGIGANTWNTAKTTGTNIIGGSWIGGNYWANPSGTGFSQTCSDGDSDGICDTAYTVGTDNSDNFPLTSNPAGPESIEVITTPPGASIYLDGGTTPLGTTPIILTGVPAGVHAVKVTYPNYFDAQRQVTVVGGGPVSVSIKMDPVPSPTVLAPKVIDAVKVVLKQKLNDDTTGVTVSAYKEPVNKPTIELFWGRPPLVFIHDQCSLVNIDHAPPANGERLITYLCVDVNNEIVETQETYALSMNYEFIHAAGELFDPGENWIPDDPDAWTPTCTENCNNYYAVLISGGTNQTLNHRRYWNDIAFMYITLIEYGYLPSHITVLMSDGTATGLDRHISNTAPMYDNSPVDLNGDNVPETIIPATKANVKTELNRLRSTLSATNNLFIFTTAHGGWDTTQNNNAKLFLWNNEQMTDDEFNNELLSGDSSIPSLTIVMEQCYGGGFNDELVDRGCQQEGAYNCRKRE